MTHPQGKQIGCVLGLVAAVGVLSACSASAPDEASSSASGISSNTTAPGSVRATTSAPAPAAAATTPTCSSPPTALVERAGMSIAAHPGTITATTYVFAATTDTGDWYVLGLDRTYVHDDGSRAVGPDGDHSRSLALTNPARRTDGEVAMIPLSVAVSEKLPASWDRVSWTGDTLAAGKRAAERAIACLDAQG